MCQAHDGAFGQDRGWSRAGGRSGCICRVSRRACWPTARLRSCSGGRGVWREVRGGAGAGGGGGGGGGSGGTAAAQPSAAFTPLLFRHHRPLLALPPLHPHPGGPLPQPLPGQGTCLQPPPIFLPSRPCSVPIRARFPRLGSCRACSQRDDVVGVVRRIRQDDCRTFACEDKRFKANIIYRLYAAVSNL